MHISKRLLPASEASHVYPSEDTIRWLPVSEANHVYPSEPPSPPPKGEQGAKRTRVFSYFNGTKVSNILQNVQIYQQIQIRAM